MSNIVKHEPRLPALQMDEQELMQVLQSSLYPGASTASIKMVLGYCKAAGLDPMQKPVHIVPMWDSKAGSMRDVVMPGVGLYRTQAARSGECAGVSEPDFGPDTTETLGGQSITFPAWCRVTVKRRLPTGEVVEFTAKEFWKENYAVKGGKEKSIAPNPVWTKRPYGQIAKCFDEHTEVLTTHGFQRFDSVTGQVLQVGERGLEPCDAKPFVQDYAGEMIVADGTRLNFSVTPNHDMLTTGGKIEAGAMFDQATKLGNKFFIPRAPACTLPDAPVPDTVLRLAGYFLADGSHTGHRQMRIAVSRQWNVDALREVALHQSEGIKRDAGRVAQVGGRDIVTTADKTQFVYAFELIESLVTPDKSINHQAVLRLSSRQAKVMADAIISFDGSDNGSGVRRLSQKNTNVLRGFEVLAVHAGYSISARTERTSDIGGTHTITVSEADHFPVVRGVEKNSASLVKRKNVTGRVWCVTVPSGVIVVRRNGFSMLCGNCAEAQALRKAFPEVGSQPTADEMEGKTLDAGEVQMVQQATAAPEHYPEDRFQKNLPAWQHAVESGKSTIDRVIAMASSIGSLTDAQERAIRAFKPPQPTADVQDVRPKDEALTFTYAQVAGKLTNAADMEQLADAGSLIGAVANADHRAELVTLYEQRSSEMEAV